MPDPRFFSTQAPLKLADAAAAIGAEMRAEGDVLCVAAPDESDLSGALVYCESKSVAEMLAGKNCGLCLTTKALASRAGAGPVLAINSPKLGFAILAARLHASLEDEDEEGAAPARISDEAVVHSSAVIAAGAEVAPGARIGPHSYIGRGVIIGEGAVIEAGCTISHAMLGRQVRVLSGARIGQAGFGFVEGGDGLVRMPQLGRVVLGDYVEIGANSTIDRGALADTVIGEGTKIDNLVQIGHNVRIGRYCVLAGQTGVSGSCVIGDGVMIGGMVGLTDHVCIGDGAQLAAGTGLMRDVPPGERWGGRPGKPIKEWLREIATLAKLAKKKNG